MNFNKLFIIVFLVSCIQRPEEKIKQMLYPEPTSYPKVLLSLSQNVSENKTNEVVWLVRSKNEETLAVTSVVSDDLHLDFKKIFVMHRYGSYDFNPTINEWEATESHDNRKSFIIQNLNFYQLPGDEFESIFLDILSEEPPLGLFNTLLVYRKGIKIFDGLDIAAELGEKYSKKINWKYEYPSGKLEFFSFDGKPLSAFIYSSDRFVESKILSTSKK
jgi:hypothetical protein